MNDFIREIYVRICLRFKDSDLDKKEILRRYLKRYKRIDISKDCIKARFK
jgi:hypothetical protein